MKISITEDEPITISLDYDETKKSEGIDNLYLKKLNNAVPILSAIVFSENEMHLFVKD